MRVTGIFTGTKISPSLQLRQCTSRYAFHAGQNLPDKEFRYLRTVIVTAAVHRGFSSLREQLTLTFRHRAGVSPYTSTFVLAETYVFGKQLHGFLSCGPAATISLISKPVMKNHGRNNIIAAGQTLFRSYGRLFAEFLDEESLVHLGLLDLSTCVGLRYG